MRGPPDDGSIQRDLTASRDTKFVDPNLHRTPALLLIDRFDYPPWPEAIVQNQLTPFLFSISILLKVRVRKKKF